MKKAIYIIISAALILSAFGCEDKKNDSKPQIPEEAEEDAALEKPFFTLSSNDFSAINVELTLSDEDPPFELGHIDLTQLDFGTRLPKCVEEGKYDELHEALMIYGYYDDESGTYIYGDKGVPDTYLDWVYEPQQGKVIRSAINGDTAYFVVSYEPLTNGDSHEWSVFSYDIHTEELTEVYSYSNTDSYNIMYNDWFLVGDTLCFTEFDSDGKYFIKSFDPETGEVKNIFNTDEDWAFNGWAFKAPGEHSLLIENMVHDEDENTNEDTIYELDIETGETEEFYHSKHRSGYNVKMSFSGIRACLDKSSEDSRTYDIITDYYRIDTGLRACELYYADESCFILMQSDDYSSLVHYFDIDKMEHYIIDVTDYGSYCTYCSGGILMTDSSAFPRIKHHLYYLMPELGLMFDVDYVDLSFDNAESSDIAEITSDGYGYNELSCIAGMTYFTVTESMSAKTSEHSVNGYNIMRDIYYYDNRE